jgi:hypothetical protein
VNDQALVAELSAKISVARSGLLATQNEVEA